PIGSMGVGVHQPEGCGHPGHYVTLNADVINNAHNIEELHNIGRSLVAGWSRYRWGVFEERGYDGHDRFPAHHVRDTKPTMTSCLPPNATGHWENSFGECDSDDIGNCRWKPDEMQQLNSSLLSHIGIPKIWGFCDKASHDPESPTPQNLLCEGRSSWEIMQEHPDFSPPQTEVPAHSSTTSRTIDRTTIPITVRNPVIGGNDNKASHSGISPVRNNWGILKNPNVNLESQLTFTSSSTTTTSRTVQNKSMQLENVFNNSEEVTESIGTIEENISQKTPENLNGTSKILYLNDVPKYKPNDNNNDNNTSKA
ncbi:unnamed protein product, partial [Meganyctiphanes norvegica]